MCVGPLQEKMYISFRPYMINEHNSMVAETVFKIMFQAASK